MEAFVVLGLCVIALIVIAPVLLFFGQSKLIKRVDALEEQTERLKRQLKQLESLNIGPPPAEPTAAASSPTPRSSVEFDDSPEAPDVDQPDETVPTSFQDTPPTPIESAVSAQPDRAPVARINHIEQFVAWTKENWVLMAGAVSLALAGVFLVQYGAERGLLTPPSRVVVALAFGLLLLVAGEVLRRRFGDENDGPTRFLPSALSGAGFFTLFAAILAARALYDLIEPGTAFLGLFLVSSLSIVFGWFYGALLSGVGIGGSILAPYLVGGDTDSPWLLSYYFLLIAVAGLAIDSFKRWAWLSVLAVIGSAGSIWLIYLTNGFPTHFLATTLLLSLAALLLPERRLVPSLGGPPIVALVLGQNQQRFPTWLAFAAVANASTAAAIVGMSSGLPEGYLALLVITLIFCGALYWLAKAPALRDLTILPAVAFLCLIAFKSSGLYTTFQQSPAPEATPSFIVAQIVLIALVASILTALNVSRTDNANAKLLQSLGAAIFTPIAIFLLEFLWAPATQYGATGWALMVVGAAAIMTFLSERAARQKTVAEPRLHSAFFAGAAVALIGLALFIVLTKTALTLALAVTVLVVVVVDRRFDLPLLGMFVQLGLLVISYRIVVDPGVNWMTLSSTTLGDVLLGHLGTAAILAVALILIRPDRLRQRVGVEGALSIIAAAFIFVIFDRYFAENASNHHAEYGLAATLWLVVSLVQLRGSAGAGRFERNLRWIVGLLVGSLALIAVWLLFTVANPLSRGSGPVYGPAFFSTLALAYLPLAGVLGFAALRMTHFPRQARLGATALSAGLCVWYIALSIRQFWRGPVLSVPGISDPELYSYTVGMLLAAAGLVAVAFQRRSHVIRKIAMVVVGVTIAKVFLVDMSGLAGLTRVLSFLGLGLALLALTWLNRVMAAQWERNDPSTQKN